MRINRLTFSQRQAAKRLYEMGVEMSKSELNRRMPELIKNGIVSGIRAPGERSFWQITELEIKKIARYFKKK
jgi:hypothetical protein